MTLLSIIFPKFLLILKKNTKYHILHQRSKKFRIYPNRKIILQKFSEFPQTYFAVLEFLAISAKLFCENRIL